MRHGQRETQRLRQCVSVQRNALRYRGSLLSLKPVSVQQWSYYGEEHRGVCIGFHTDHVDPQEMYRVAYTKRRTAIPNELLLSEKESDCERRLSRMMRSSTTKDEAWEHEDEVRFLKRRKGAFAFPPGNLKTIYFGYRCHPNDITYTERLNSRSECEPRIAIMQPSPEGFDMVIDSVDNFDSARRIARNRR